MGPDRQLGGNILALETILQSTWVQINFQYFMLFFCWILSAIDWVIASGCPGGPLPTTYSIQGNVEIAMSEREKGRRMMFSGVQTVFVCTPQQPCIHNILAILIILIISYHDVCKNIQPDQLLVISSSDIMNKVAWSHNYQLWSVKLIKGTEKPTSFDTHFQVYYYR